mmetsp:Transcript_2313/g.3230  ORF Transcript_2313/g.3230 Transcript_2313/m.3230 type:complete len:236 (+) Transcript_2313:111-818(+)|eukprot:CAMPEP_0117753698 /NCGR_PEP_ID=MMETSP0947-20121206/12389_1 /TAXON_ID=44440 /ORGANISM="Chattonella subsalsa, Strain CCMP2191" /LENGTH=235 /DNA_ID=CAMNT_0005572647 /DNA_START=214 /DNA_END=921 /DNA_ORIENTATION=+
MGIVFGVTGSEEPAYELVADRPGYQIRHYPAYFVAEVDTGSLENSNKAFGYLARYIGVFGTPENTLQHQEGTKAPESLAMTAPVIMEPKPSKLAMTAPVIMEPNQKSSKMAMTSPVINEQDSSGDQVMQFVLPFHLKSMDEVPVPTNPVVKVRHVPEKIIACNRFSGQASEMRFEAKRNSLIGDIIKDNILQEPEKYEYSVAQYHPPFTLGPLRRNEIWLKIPLTLAQVKAKLPK